MDLVKHMERKISEPYIILALGFFGMIAGLFLFIGMIILGYYFYQQHQESKIDDWIESVQQEINVTNVPHWSEPLEAPSANNKTNTAISDHHADQQCQQLYSQYQEVPNHQNFRAAIDACNIKN